MTDDSLAEKLRQPISTAIATQKSHAVPRVCVRYGMPAGDADEAFRSKFNYVMRRLEPLSSEAVVRIAYKVRREYPHDGLTAVLLEAERPQQNLMRLRPYYSVRSGKNPQAHALSLPYVLEHFKALHQDLESRRRRGGFADRFGDADRSAGEPADCTL